MKSGFVVIKEQYKNCPMCGNTKIRYNKNYDRTLKQQLLSIKCQCGFFSVYDSRLNEISYGNKDEIGGIHDQGIGYNPNGVFCGECGNTSCTGCINANLKEFNFTLENNFKKILDKYVVCPYCGDKMYYHIDKSTLSFNKSTLDDYINDIKETFLKEKVKPITKEVIGLLNHEYQYCIAYCNCGLSHIYINDNNDEIQTMLDKNLVKEHEIKQCVEDDF